MEKNATLVVRAASLRVLDCCSPHSFDPTFPAPAERRSYEVGEMVMQAEINRLHSNKLRLAWEMCCRFRFLPLIDLICCGLGDTDLE